MRPAAAPGVRPIRPEDAVDLQQFIRGLSPASRHARFMMGIRELPEYMLDRFVRPVPDREAGLVAHAPAGGIVGLAQYVADSCGDGCEVALVVTDAWQRRGLGMRLLNALATLASERSIVHFYADVYADNHAMRALARKAGCDARVYPGAAFLVRISRTIISSVKSDRITVYQ